MRLASWRWGGTDHVGLISPDGREATPLACGDASRGVHPLIEALAEGRPLPREAGTRLPVSAISLRAPLPRPHRNLFCVGRNYRAHAAELAGTVFRDSLPKEDEWPIVFTKTPQTVIGPYDTVRLPGRAVTEQIDYESELAIVIGRPGRDIPKGRAMEHVLGYTVVNDVSARDVQTRHQQWDLGKSFDTFCPMGPWIVTADELDGRATRVRGWVNGELRQDGRTEDMIFDIPTLIETCSRGITLLPGDIIATGTPSGVGMGFKPPRWLKAGDVFKVEIDGIGAIENRFQ
ncbi:fumarylacetoacetate hydrolase family protein [Pseudorhodoferax soli]|uniref:2-keto-4-pentenoate hydratase/2-oxohepta-3-ene-1,7-dioic acid hydratase in catechol pathway n=1 Tax=Pseudorhodoferax soli TaxID=545864 RepID=A0A368XDF7_9BURK|nr:fumarylacetoacetate hydrolase family protein [Pseudorhodoferax soli]RCW64467.1 2-keto-4-pentenoate hydratase/2-oxohepta-3-ene-1,7-dioic acid hydratase in catechol pathway [Pseudorhodoferax soli]